MELAKSQQLVQLVQLGAGNTAKLAGYTQPEIDRAVYQGVQVIAAKGGNVGEYLVNQYNNGAEHVNPLYKNQLQAGLRAAKQEGHSGAAFEQSYSMVKQLSAIPGGKSTAIAYLGDDAVRMMKYDQFVQNRLPPETAYQLSFGEPLDSTRKSSDKEISERIIQTVEDDQPGVWGKMFGDIPLSDQSQRVLATAVGRNFDKLAGNLAMDDDNAMKVALNVAKGELDVVGPYVYERGGDRAPVYPLIGTDEKTAGTVFSRFINERARENGILSPLPGAAPKGDSVAMVADVITAGPAAALKRAATRRWGDEPNVMIMRLPDQAGTGMF